MGDRTVLALIGLVRALMVWLDFDPSISSRFQPRRAAVNFIRKNICATLDKSLRHSLSFFFPFRTIIVTAFFF